MLTGSFLDFMEILFVTQHADRRVCCTTVISDRPRHFEPATKTVALLEYKKDSLHVQKYQLIRIRCQVSMLSLVWF